MSKNENLHSAKKAKNDEFYTQLCDIEREMNAYVEYNPDVFRGKTILCPCDDPEWSNFTLYFALKFEELGLKKLISTSYAKSSGNMQLTMCEMEAPFYDKELHDTHGKLYIVEKPFSQYTDALYADNIEFRGYLKGDGDFRSEEVTKLRDEADIIITNPPFSLFREFLSWIREGKKQFLIIGNQNAITYRKVFPLLKDNQIWLGCTHPKEFLVSLEATNTKRNVFFDEKGKRLAKFGNICWYTNLDHYVRHETIGYMTMRDNLRFNKRLRKVLIDKYGQDPEHLHYEHYDNYDAIEVPFSNAIPEDYDGVMGVPITFLGKYNPEQFLIVGMSKPPLGNHLRPKIYPKQIQHGRNGKISTVTKLNDGGAIVVDTITKMPFYSVGDTTYVATYPRILLQRILNE